MKASITSILKWLGIVLTGLILAGILVPFVFKDKVIQYIKEASNKNINATVDFKDAHLSVFSSFPSLRITIDSLSVIGLDTFEGIVLYAAPTTYIDVNFSSIIGKNKIPEINRLYTNKPEINIVVLDTMNTNYLIQKKESTSTDGTYKLVLKSYEIKDGKLTYQDNTMNLYTSLGNVNHSGKGNFTQDVFDLKTETQAENVLLEFGGTTYLNNVKAKLIADFNLNFPEEKYTLLNNDLQINDFNVKADGFFQMKKEGIYNDITFKTASESFKSFLSLIPGAYIKDFKSVKATGYASVSGFVKGIYNDHQFPAFELKCKIDNGYTKYPILPQEIKDIHADVNIKSSQPNLSDLNINIPSFKLKIGNDPVNGRLLVARATADQQISGLINAKLNLANLKNAFPIENILKLSGSIDCNVDFNAKMSDITEKNYNKITFKGSGTGNSIMYQSLDHPIVSVSNASLNVSPQTLNIAASDIKLGKSDASLTINVENPLSIFLIGNSIRADIKIKAGNLDLNEWRADDKKSTSTTSTSAPVTLNGELLKNSGLNLDIQAAKVLFNDMTIDNVNINGKMAANALEINDMSAKINKSDLRITGTVINAYDYLFNNNTLDGNLTFISDYFDANQFLVSSKGSNASEVTSTFPVPDRVRIQLHTKIKELIYTNLQLKNFSGLLEVKNNEVALKNLETNTLGGKLMLEGLYNTSDLTKPDFAVKLDLSKIAFAEAISKIDMFKKVAPIAEFINGFFNTSVVMRGKLGGTMMPDLSTLDASGLIETINGAIKGSNPMAELSQKTGLKELTELNLSNTKNWFEIVKGFMELKPYNTRIKGIDFTISGKHGFGKEMDYKINLIVPREILKKNKLLNVAEAGLSNIEKEASKLGINIQQGPQVFLDVLMTGPFKKPNIKIIPRNSAGSAYNEALENKASEVIKNVSDSIKTEIKKKEAELKDTITKRANEELEKIKSQAEKIADKAVDSIKTVAKDQVLSKLDTLTKGVISDSIRQKAKDVFDKKSSEEVEKIKEKLKDFNPFKKKKEGGG